MDFKKYTCDCGYQGNRNEIYVHNNITLNYSWWNCPNCQTKNFIPPKKKESETIEEVIRAARTIQEFLWKEMNDGCGLEEYKRMFRKRIAKINAIDMANPHWKIELKKRLLQMAAVSVNLITKIDNDEITHDGIHPTLPSNLPEYSKPLSS